MPLYFFHLVSKQGTAFDLEGTELADLEHARLEAVKDARNLMSQAVRNGRDISSRRIRICDVHANLLLEVAFRDTLTPDD